MRLLFLKDSQLKDSASRVPPNLCMFDQIRIFLQISLEKSPFYFLGFLFLFRGEPRILAPQYPTVSIYISVVIFHFTV